jgi:hypothetical protein
MGQVLYCRKNMIISTVMGCNLFMTIPPLPLTHTLKHTNVERQKYVSTNFGKWLLWHQVILAVFVFTRYRIYYYLFKWILRKGLIIFRFFAAIFCVRSILTYLYFLIFYPRIKFFILCKNTFPIFISKQLKGYLYIQRNVLYSRQKKLLSFL